MPGLYKVEGVVLRRVRQGESDILVTLFTSEMGKLTLVARGAGRVSSRRAPHLEPLRHIQLMAAEGRRMDTVREASTVNAFSRLREDLERMSCALCLAELVYRFTAEREPNRDILAILLRGLESLCSEANPQITLHWFELWLLRYVGYRPELYNCVACKARLPRGQNFFSPAEGGVLCPGCRTGDSVAVSLEALKVLRFVERVSLAQAQRLRISEPLASELTRITRRYIQYQLEEQLGCWQLIDDLWPSRA